MQDLIDEFDQQHLWHPYTSILNPVPAFKVSHADGVYLYLSNGQRIIDGTSSWWCNANGYNHPRINQAIQDQLTRMSHLMFGGLTHDGAIKLGKKLLSLLDPSLDTIFYTDSGSVAVEVALKMALQYQYSQGQSSKQNFATIYRGYHGDTYNAMSLCDRREGMHTLFEASLPMRYFIEPPKASFYDDYDEADDKALELFFEQKGDELAAFILEPIMQGAGGMHFYHPRFLQKLRACCTKHQVLLIFDEIATGFYRTGKRFAYEHSGVIPDIITLGKALTSGYLPMAVAICQNFVARSISSHEPFAFMHGPTYMANPLACAAALEALNLYEEQAYEQVQFIEQVLKDKLSDLKDHPKVKDVRILGAVAAIELHSNIDIRVIEPLFIQHQVWLRPFGNIIYTMPPYIINQEQLELLCKAIHEVIAAYV